MIILSIFKVAISAIGFVPAYRITGIQTIIQLSFQKGLPENFLLVMHHVAMLSVILLRSLAVRSHGFMPALVMVKPSIMPLRFLVGLSMAAILRQEAVRRMQ